MMLVNSLRNGLVASLLSWSAVTAAVPGWDGQRTLDGTSGKANSPFNDEVEEFVHDVMGRWKIPGMSVAVIDGEDVYAQVRNI